MKRTNNKNNKEKEVKAKDNNEKMKKAKGTEIQSQTAIIKERNSQ